MAVSELRALPSVEELLQTPQAAELIASHGRPLVLEAIRSILADIRSQYHAQDALPDWGTIFIRVRERLGTWTHPSLVPVINATGVVLHTNLGRAPLSRAALQAVQRVGEEYSNLEYDLERGGRGSRSVHTEALLKHLTGAEAALVVNNNAAGVLLALTALARRRRVVISRTQLVEIGGGFRVPDVMNQSGARLIEIGTTNRVHLSDYENALSDTPPALVFHAHPSNFRMIGFTSEPSLAELAAAAHRAGVPVVDDLGSGALLDTSRFGLAHEVTVQESLAAGCDLVCFSGDKLLGGPQAGILLGRADLLEKVKKHPMARAVRADKLCLAALSATLLHYLKDEAEREIPIWRMISQSAESIQLRARHWSEKLGKGEVIPGQSTIGGGSLPGENLPTFLLSLSVRQPNRFLDRLRDGDLPLIARVEADRVVLDPRTVLEEQEDALIAALGNALKDEEKGGKRKK